MNFCLELRFRVILQEGRKFVRWDQIIIEI